jgi:hypothetical protein
MMSLAGASRAVVPTLDELAEFPATRPSAAEGTGAAIAPWDAAATVPLPAAAAELLALLPEHPARNIPPASKVPPIARAAAPDRMRLALADRRFKLNVFSMRV